mmetsp:Transcript_26976/g.42029  ORF Transcript_26976/g.42029 Transcript_26976/m.42029 type:complete len:276 (-) Transcript_26976:112-939(-)
MKPLSHFYTSMSNKNRPICVNMNEAMRLIQGSKCEAQSKFRRNERDSLLLPLIILIKRCYFLISGLKITHLFTFSHNSRQISRSHFHPKMSSVIRRGIQISLSDNVGREAGCVRDVLNVCLCYQHALRSPKSSKRSVTKYICLTNFPNSPHIGDIVRVIAVKQCPLHNRERQVVRMPSIAVQLHINGSDFTIFFETDFVLSVKRVTFSCCLNVLISRNNQPNRPVFVVCCNRSRTSIRDSLCFFSTKPSSQSPHFRGYSVGIHSHHRGNEFLCFV